MSLDTTTDAHLLSLLEARAFTRADATADEVARSPDLKTFLRKLLHMVTSREPRSLKVIYPVHQCKHSESNIITKGIFSFHTRNLIFAVLSSLPDALG
jgi:hypothetical protein